MEEMCKQKIQYGNLSEEINRVENEIEITQFHHRIGTSQAVSTCSSQWPSTVLRLQALKAMLMIDNH